MKTKGYRRHSLQSSSVHLKNNHHCFSSVHFLSHGRLFVTPWTIAGQASLSITNSRSLLKLMSIESVMLPTISSFVVPFSSCLQSFPTSGSFQMSQLFISSGQNYLHHFFKKRGRTGYFPLVWSRISSFCYTVLKEKSYPLSQAVLHIWGETSFEHHISRNHFHSD